MTLGRKVWFENENSTEEVISLFEVKDLLNITFDNHNQKIERLIKACRSALETFTEKSFINYRNVNVSWQELDGVENIPFCPCVNFDGVVVDFSGNDISSSVKINNLGGFLTIEGKCIYGVKLSFISSYVGVNLIVKEGLLRSVVECFESDSINPTDSIRRIFKNQNIF